MFLPLAEEIAKLATKALHHPYDPSHVEISVLLSDHFNDGDYQLLCRAKIRNPVELVYDYLVDVMGPPEDALLQLKKELQEKLDKVVPPKHNLN